MFWMFLSLFSSVFEQLIKCSCQKHVHIWINKTALNVDIICQKMFNHVEKLIISTIFCTKNILLSLKRTFIACKVRKWNDIFSNKKKRMENNCKEVIVNSARYVIDSQSHLAHRYNFWATFLFLVISWK